MADDSNTTYFATGQGTIAGFDAASLEGNPTNLVRTGWSIDQLKAWLLNEGYNNFPSEHWVKSVNTAINNHLQDFNNPHKVTFSQVVNDIVSQVMGSVTAGTPPVVPPIFAFDAICPLPLNDIFPASYLTTNLYRMTDSGMLVDPSTELEVIGADSGMGKAGIPLFSNLTNILVKGWTQQPNILNNTTISEVPHPTLSYPFHFYSVSETGATGGFGIRFPLQANPATVYTATFFIVPSLIGGSLIISQPNDAVSMMTVSLDDGSFTCSTDFVSGDTLVYPNGMIRVSFSFMTASIVPDNALVIIHQNDGDSTPIRVGTAGRPLFTIAHPWVTTSSLNQPIPIDRFTSASCTPLTLAMAKVSAPPYLTNVMVTLTLDLCPMIPGAMVTDTTVFTLGTLKITRDQTNIYVTLAGVAFYTSEILEGLNVITVSYSPTQVICKDLATPRRTFSAAFPPLSTLTASVGPCSGYLQSLAIYAASDTNQAVEYLTNG